MNTISDRLVRKEIYHVCNKSIAGYKILKSNAHALRFIKLLDYYNNLFIAKSYSNYLQVNKTYEIEKVLGKKQNAIVKILGYCIMPSHYHLLVRILKENVASLFIANVENSFTRYFNVKTKRKGPLWQSRFKRVRVQSNEQLLHVSRYIHLNPTTASLVKKPEDWKFSSYNEYIYSNNLLKNEMNEISIRTANTYRKFVEDNIDYQKKLGKIKRLLLE